MKSREEIASKVAQIDSLPYNFGFDKIGSEATDYRERLFEEFGDAYQELVEGIYADFQKDPSIRVETKPTGYINGVVCGWEEKLRIGNKFDQNDPNYLVKYRGARGRLYSLLFWDSIEYANFDILFRWISNVKDPVPAKDFLSTVYGEKERYPYVIAGNATEVISGIDQHNMTIDVVNDALMVYARERRLKEQKKELMKDTVGVLGSLAIGLRSKFNGGLKKYLETVVLEPVFRTAELPIIEKQLLDRERASVSLIDD